MYCDVWKSDNYTGSNTEKKAVTKDQIQKKEVKSDKFCCCKVVRAITKWGAIEKSTF